MQQESVILKEYKKGEIIVALWKSKGIAIKDGVAKELSFLDLTMKKIWKNKVGKPCYSHRFKISDCRKIIEALEELLTENKGE